MGRPAISPDGVRSNWLHCIRLDAGGVPLVSSEDFGEAAAASPALVAYEAEESLPEAWLRGCETEDAEVPNRPPDEFTDPSILELFPVVKWQSIDHRMTHFPMLADCPICQRANKKRKQHRSRQIEGHVEAKKLGHIVTTDFIPAYTNRISGLRTQGRRRGPSGRRHCNRLCRRRPIQENG